MEDIFGNKFIEYPEFINEELIIIMVRNLIGINLVCIRLYEKCFCCIMSLLGYYYI